MQNVPLLLGAQCSRCSARVRSYLIKKRIAYVERVPTLWTYNITIARRFGDPAVPVLITPEGEWIADSEVILDHLEACFPNEPILPPDPVHAFFTTFADIWASEFWQQVDVATRWLGRTQYPWWYEELGEGMLIGFPKAMKNALVGSVARKIQAHLPRLGATTETRPLIWRWAGQTMDALDAHFAEHFYLLGERATLQPIIRSIFDEFLPYVEGTLAELRRTEPKPVGGKRIERFLGMVNYPYAGSTHQRLAMPFMLWLVQRALDLYTAMPAADAERVRCWLGDLGAVRLLELDIPRLEVSGLTVKFA